MGSSTGKNTQLTLQENTGEGNALGGAIAIPPSDTKSDKINPVQWYSDVLLGSTSPIQQRLLLGATYELNIDGQTYTVMLLGVNTMDKTGTIMIGSEVKQIMIGKSYIVGGVKVVTLDINYYTRKY